MTTSVLLDHVSAYAAAVRSHLADLPADQVEDLTDGLEADLAEALEDREGPVVTGEIPIGWAGAAAGIPAAPGAAPGASMIDLTRRFGPARAYAAELRAAAGLEPATGARTSRRPRRVRERVAELRRLGGEALTPVLTAPAGRAVVSFLVSLRPLWWVLRGWLWFVILLGVHLMRINSPERGIFRYVPRSGITWAVLAALVLASIAVGRRSGTGGRRAQRVVVVLSVAALLTLPWATIEFRSELQQRLSLVPRVEYVQLPAEAPTPAEDGVYVDGMLVSNLFVYDAQGNPLDRVQIFDDRGRPVRTIGEGGAGAWSLPGVDEPWVFGPDTAVDGRLRWNVYPLLGVPFGEMGDAGDGVEPSDAQPRTPPLPFEKAPALVGAADAGTETDAGATAGATRDATG
jgi:hypothetical protein